MVLICISFYHCFHNDIVPFVKVTCHPSKKPAVAEVFVVVVVGAVVVVVVVGAAAVVVVVAGPAIIKINW